MKAAIYTGDEQIELRDVDPMKAEPAYVIVNTKSSGICGSDLHAYFGHWSRSEKRAHGHEVCGTVVEIGEGVDGFKVGDKVTMECFSHDGTCTLCDQGHYNHCLGKGGFSGEGHGGFAEYTAMHASSLFKLPDDFTFEQGALVEPLAVCHRAVMQAGATSRDRVVVLGGGTIGLLTLAAAKAAGVRETLITVKYPQQTEVAKAYGADRIVDVNEEDVTEVVKEWTDDLGADCVIETVGGASNFDAAVACARKRGIVVLVAGYFEPLEVDLRKIVWSEVVVTGSNCYGYSGREKDFDAAIEMIASGRVDPTKIVTHRYGLDEIVEAFRVSADKKSGSVKVHIVQ